MLVGSASDESRGELAIAGCISSPSFSGLSSGAGNEQFVGGLATSGNNWDETFSVVITAGAVGSCGPGAFLAVSDCCVRANISCDIATKAVSAFNSGCAVGALGISEQFLALASRAAVQAFSANLSGSWVTNFPDSNDRGGSALVGAQANARKTLGGSSECAISVIGFSSNAGAVGTANVGGSGKIFPLDDAVLGGGAGSGTGSGECLALATR